MSGSIVIRSATERDLAPLDVTYPEPGSPEGRHIGRWKLQEADEGVYLVAWSGDQPIGWVFLHRPGSPEASAHARELGVAEVMDLFVTSAFRGRGHGSSLLEAAEGNAREAGWTSIGLEVTVSNPHNDVARAMYERRGYHDAALGEFESGYFYWTETGQRRWDGEPHRFLIKFLSGA